MSRLQEAQARRDARAEASQAALERRDDPPRAQRSTSVEDARAVTRATRTDAPPQARARAASGEGDRELVSISDEARQLLRRARERDRQEDVRAEAAAQLQTAPGSFSSQLIAVRVGPTPVEDLPRPLAESRAAEQLSERAFLRQLERVLSLPERPPGEKLEDDELEGGADVRLLGEADEDEDRTGATGPPGSRERPAFTRNELEVARSPFAGVERSASSARLIGSEPARAARREQEGLERELAPSLRDADLVRATSLAPQSGAARPPRADGERTAENSGPVDARGAPTLDAAPQLSQAAVLEADASTSIVTRFLGNLDAPEPGPAPRVRQFLGERP